MNLISVALILNEVEFVKGWSGFVHGFSIAHNGGFVKRLWTVVQVACEKEISVKVSSTNPRERRGDALAGESSEPLSPLL